MAYRDLRKIFHGYPKTYATEYESRFNSDQSHKVGFDVSGSPAFFVMTPEIYQAAIDAAKSTKRSTSSFSLCLGKRYKAIGSRTLSMKSLSPTKSKAYDLQGAKSETSSNDWKKTTNVDASTVLFKNTKC